MTYLPHRSNSKIWNLHPSLWTCVSNLKMYPFDKWIKFSDISKDLFYDIWNEIEKCPNLILNEEATAFKKTKWVNFNRLNNDVFASYKNG